MAEWQTSPIDSREEHYINHPLKGACFVGSFNPEGNWLLSKKYGGRGLRFKAVMSYTDRGGTGRFIFEAFKTRKGAKRFVEKRADELVADGAERKQ